MKHEAYLLNKYPTRLWIRARQEQKEQIHLGVVFQEKPWYPYFLKHMDMVGGHDGDGLMVGVDNPSSFLQP